MKHREPRKDFRGTKKRAARLDSQLGEASIVHALRVPDEGWIKSSRLAVGMTLIQLARRIRTSQPALTKLEQREAEGTISIGKLAALAESLECDFVYGFVPRGSFEDSPLWDNPDR